MAIIKSLAVLLLLSMTVMVVVAELQRFDHAVKSDGSLSFLVVGDWGRRGLYNQSNVAYQMGNVGEKMKVDFIVSTGDNFYDSGLIDENDPAFYESFTNVYTAPSLQKQWYSGNTEFFFVDTTPFEDKYFTETKHNYDWRGVLPREKYIEDLLQDVDMALKASSAKWKIVVGHHTIFSAGIHGNTQELVHKLLPILKANEVNLYINGHDHCLQHISGFDSALQFLTSGGGSKAWRGKSNPWNPDELKFYYDGQGFMAGEITKDGIYVAFYDIFGNELHKWSVSGNTHSDS